MGKLFVKRFAVFGTLAVAGMLAWTIWQPASSAESRSQFMPTVQEYVDARKQAVLAGDVGILHKRYPELINGTDPHQGINNEAQVVERYRAFRLTDGQIDPEHYEPIQVTLQDDTAEVVVHGMETYTKDDAEVTGGEFEITLYLKQAENGVWTVTKTDEQTLEERHSH